VTNFLIGYPDIPLRSTAFTASAAEDPSYPLKNLITGGRGRMFQFNAAQTSYWIKADMGASATASMQFFFLARANMLKKAGVTQCILQSSPNDAAWTNRIGTAANFQSKTFTGPRSEDLLFTQTFNDDAANYTSSAIRYWRITGLTASSKMMFSKFYLGNWFDFGKEPVVPIVQRRQGYEFKNREARHIFKMSWQGIDDATRQSFNEKILRYKDINPVILYDTADLILNDMRTLHAWITDCKVRPITYNRNDISVTFEEAI
jgi:hypothetical protein